MDVATAHATALEAAERGAVVLRAVWPGSVQAMSPAAAPRIRDAMRSLEDAWADLLYAADEVA